jgi:[protein-PII] uridylyltransferase
VSRPDLLVLGALLHDIGKGRGEDHSMIGAELAIRVGNRLGLWPSDIRLLAGMVRHHLLLPSTATKDDLADPATAAGVVEALDRDPVLLELLAALTEADSLATGPGVWSDWKATLIGDLVRRCRVMLAGDTEPKPEPIPAEHLSLARDGAVHVEMVSGESPHTYAVTMIAPDRRGLLSKAAGVLALNSLSVHSATVNSADGSAINTFVVSPLFGTPPAAELVRQQFILALDGDLDVIGSLQKRDHETARYGSGPAGPPNPAVPAAAPAPPKVLWHDGGQSGRQLVEVRASDRTGMLAVLTGVFERAGVDIAWAKITTLGSSVIDVFAISAPDSATAADALERDLYEALPAPPPVKPAAAAG